MSLLSIEKWGPNFWQTLHTVCFTYAGDRHTVHRFIHRFADVIPCARCREHFKQVLCNSPPRFESREALAAWSVAAHNAVNKRLGKPHVPYADVAPRYGGMGSSPPVAPMPRADLVISVVAVVITLLLLALGVARAAQKNGRVNVFRAP